MIESDNMDNKENNFEHIINNQPEESMMIQNIEETPEQLQESVAESSSTFSNETSFNEENTKNRLFAPVFSQAGA